MTIMALLFLINLTAVILFYIKRKDGKGYDLYVKHEDAFINTGIIENPEDYKSPKIYLAKGRLRNFYETLNKFIFLFLL